LDLWREGEVIEDRYLLHLPRTLPPGGYTLWIGADGAEPIMLDAFTVAPLHRSFAVPEMPTTADIAFTGKDGEGVRLLGYALDPFVPGQLWRVTLAWQALAEITDDFVIFLHLRETGSDTPVAQADAMPLQGSYPTSLWLGGEVVVDHHQLAVPADLAPGDYTLYVGFYTPEGARLLAAGSYRARLAELEVAP
jgi:hypothetical protein